MEFCCSLHMVNLNFYEMDRNQRDCKFFWEELLKNIGAAGFRGIELPYEPYWESIGRIGIPLNEYCLTNGYGSMKNFRNYLKQCGIDRISNLYFDPRFLAAEDLDEYFASYERYIALAIEEAEALETTDVVITLSGEIGYLKACVPKGESYGQFRDTFRQRTVEILKQSVAYARKRGIVLSAKNEYWSLARGDEIAYYLDQIPELMYAPDLAHLAISQVDIDGFLEKYAERLKVVTFSDTCYTDTENCYEKVCPEYPEDGEEQRVYCDLGYGKLCLEKHFQKLQELGYKGEIVFECKQTEDYNRALLRMKRAGDQLRGESVHG